MNSLVNKLHELTLTDTGTVDKCFAVTYAVVLLGFCALVCAGILSSNWRYFAHAGWLLASAVLGRVAPLYPVGIASVFMAGFVVVEVIASAPTK